MTTTIRITNFIVGSIGSCVSTKYNTIPTTTRPRIREIMLTPKQAYMQAYNKAYRQRKLREDLDWGREQNRSAGRRYYYKHRDRCAQASDRRRRANLGFVSFTHQLRRQRLTLDQYHARLESQDFRCAICGDLPQRLLTIDHDHTTNVARG